MPLGWITISSVGSSTAAVAGSSEGWTGNVVPLALVPFTKPWLEITVLSGTPALMVTSNTMVATLFAAGSGSARIAPGVRSSGALISMPPCSAVVPPVSGTGAPFRVVLLAT